jgi:hypothetical protein
MTSIPPDDSEQHLCWLEAQAEKSYSDMYEAHSLSAATAHYSDAKEYLYDAIGLARGLGKHAEEKRLSDRLAHIQAVFRSQFSF